MTSHYTDTFHENAPFNDRIVNFACHDCERRWRSANGSLDDYQKCKNCYTKCYPVSYKIQAPNKDGNDNRETYQSHNKELCGKCERLGRSCMMLGNDYSDSYRIITNADGEDLYLGNVSNEQSSEPKGNKQAPYVVDPYQWPDLATHSLPHLSTTTSQNKSNYDKQAPVDSDQIESLGITAAETLKQIIEKARQENYYQDYLTGYDPYEHGFESLQEYDDYDYSHVDEVWDYDSIEHVDIDESGHLYYNDGLNQYNEEEGGEDVLKQNLTDDIQDQGDEDVLEQNLTDYVQSQGGQDVFEQYLVDDIQSQEDEAYFNDTDEMGLTDSVYAKELSNRLLRRGRKHELLGRKV